MAPISASRPSELRVSVEEKKTHGGLSVTRVKHEVTLPLFVTLQGEIDSFAQTIGAGSFQPLGPTITQNYVKKNGHTSDEIDGLTPDTAACGSASVAAMLNRFGKFAVTEGVDDHLRVTKGLGGSLFAGVDYLRSRGLQAQQYNGGSWADLRRGIDGGFGVIVSITHAETVHTLLVTGMYKDEAGKEFIQVQDWLGLAMPMTLTRADFEAGWERASLGGLDGVKTGIRRTFAFVGEAGARLPEGGSLVGELGSFSSHVLLDGFHAMASGGSYIGEGEVLGGVSRFLGGVIETVPQLPSAFVQLAGATIEWSGDRLIDVIRKAETVPQVIGAVFLCALAGPIKALGWIFRVVAQLAGLFVSAITRTVAYPFLKLSEVMHSDNDACNQLSYCDANGNDREKRNYADLVASPASAKIELIESMLSGVVGERERRMTLRALEAASVEQRSQIFARVEKLRSAFAGTKDEQALLALQRPA